MDEPRIGDMTAPGLVFAFRVLLQFDSGPVKADTHILLFAKLLAPRLMSITVKDPVRGDLTFP